MSSPENAVLALLNPNDELRVVLEVAHVSTGDDSMTTGDDKGGGYDPRQDSLNRRVLAVISHRDDWDLSEEGCLFVCKPKRNVHDYSETLDIQRVYPIYGSFAINMTQMRRQTLDLTPNTTKSVLDQPRSGFSISITPGDATSDSSSDSSGSSSASSSSYRGHSRPTFYTYDVQHLRQLIAECKRLKGSSDIDASVTTSAHLAQSTHQFTWVRAYINKKTLFAFSATNPPDIRLSNRPLTDRLSAASAGLPGDDNVDIDAVRDEWIRSRVKEEVRRGKKRLRVRIGTFNVNGKLPSQDLSAWIQATPSTQAKLGVEREVGRMAPSIPPVQTISPLTNILKNPLEWVTATKLSPENADKTGPKDTPEPLDETSDPDLFVLSFQEVDLSTEALIYSTSTVREDAWCTAVFAALGEKGVLYEKLASKQLVGMLVVLIVKKSLRKCFGDVRTSVAGAGLLGVMGNKGGVAMRLTFTPPAPQSTDVGDDKSETKTEFDEKGSDTTTPARSFNPGPTTLTFVNSHLAAFDEMFERRNADYHDLSKRLGFEASEEQKKQKRIEKGISDYYEDEDGMELVQGGVGVFESDAVFWMGDLNYRLDLPDSDVRNVLADEDWDGKYDTLLRFDQLKKAMKSDKAFSGFKEFPISHAPSYRFSPGLLADKLGYDVKRKPAWTDRILNMPSAACQVHQRTYSCHPQITMSDHRPVAADFDVDVDYYDKDFHEAAVQKLFRLVGHMEDSHDRPIVKVDNTFVEFGKVFYGRPTSCELKVENMGKTPCVFRFVPADADVPIHPDWLRIEPMAGLLLPGETAIITLSVLIDNPLAAVMNARPKDLSGTLILHTVTGKDHFISISGEYQYTCFANKHSTLTRLPGPIRSLASPTDLRAKNRPISASREVMRLVNWLMSTSGDMDELFLKGADEHMVDTIRECLDTGAEFPYNAQTAGPEVFLAFAVTLLRLLDSLVDPVIPAPLHSRCLQMTNRDEALEILGVLPPTSVNVWISVSAFLHFLCQTSKDEEHAEKLAHVFAPVIMRDDANSASTALPASPAGKRKFIQFFLS